MWEIPGVEYVYSTSQPGRVLDRGSLPGGGRRRAIAGEAAPEAAGERRPDAAGRVAAAGQGPLDRRRAHPRADLPRPALRPPGAATARRAGRCRDQTRARGLRDHPHRWLPAASTNPARPARARGAWAGRPRRAPDAGPGQPTGDRAARVTADDRDVIVQTGGFFTSTDDVDRAVVGVHARPPGLPPGRGPGAGRRRGADPVRPVRRGGGGLARCQRGAGGHARGGQAAGEQRHHRGPGRPGPGGSAEGHGDPGRRLRLHHPALRDVRSGEVERAPAPHGHRGGGRLAARPLHARLARVDRRRGRHSIHPVADAAASSTSWATR